VPVTFEVSPIICDTIITDEEWLWQMLLNLLTNACKYTDHGSIDVKVSLTHEASRSSEKTAVVAGVRGATKSANSITASERIVPTSSTNYLLFEVADTGTLCAIMQCLLQVPSSLSVARAVLRCGHS
jgi:signal transduction histidine kinase